MTSRRHAKCGRMNVIDGCVITAYGALEVQGENMKKDLSRLVIFVFFDPHGIVDEYVVRLLQALRSNAEKIIVVSNVTVDGTAMETLERYSDEVFLRENCGLDAAAFKAGMVKVCGWDEVEKYDEVVLVNDTFFGPIHSFGEMFAEMAGRSVDFWGMSVHYAAEDGWDRVKYGYIPTHIQTFFTVFRKNMVCSKVFQDYWNNYDDTMNDFVSVVTQHETTMTKYFQDRGFRWSVYSDTSKYDTKYRDEHFNLYHHHPYQMIHDMKFPVFKKKVLNINMTDFLYMNDLEEPAEAMQYIHTESDYDTKLIWDNVLRLYNVTDLYNSLHLNYIFPSDHVDVADIRQAALVYHVTNPFFAERICKHAAQISGLIDVYIIPGNPTVRQLVEQAAGHQYGVKILSPTKAVEDMESLVLLCRDIAEKYTYLGFVHDIENKEHCPTVVMESTVYGYLQNVANDTAYVEQVVRCFEKNPRLGLLGTPYPIHHNYFSTYGQEWGQWYDDTCSLAETMNLRCKLSKEKNPFILTGAFWCRTEALRVLWEADWSDDQFVLDKESKISPLNEAIKRILPYVAQHEGFYSGIAMHVNYASMRITGQQYMLGQIVEKSMGFAGYEKLSFAVFMECLGPLRMGLVRRCRIFLEKHTPHWFSCFARKVFRYIKSKIRKILRKQ